MRLVVDEAKSKSPVDQVFGVVWSGEDLEFVVCGDTADPRTARSGWTPRS